MKFYLSFATMFCFQLVASLRPDAKALRLRSTAGAKPKAGHDERGLAKTKVVTTTAVTVVEAKPVLASCAPGVTAADSAGHCCKVGETIVNDICCPAGVTATSSWYQMCCAPGKVAATNMFGFTYCCPPGTKVYAHDGCCDASITVAKLFCDW
jgi:hypothetical protein